jgi:predicted enzyme related to lactoylglutathione lyase
MFSHVSYTSVPVDDVARALRFYRDLLGMKVVADAPHATGRWVMLSVADARTLIHLDDRPDRPTRPGRVVLALIAADVDRAVDRLRGLDVEIVQEAKAAEWSPLVRYALFRDSERNIVLVADG